jgi:hypothetical protein
MAAPKAAALPLGDAPSHFQHTTPLLTEGKPRTSLVSRVLLFPVSRKPTTIYLRGRICWPPPAELRTAAQPTLQGVRFTATATRVAAVCALTAHFHPCPRPSRSRWRYTFCCTGSRLAPGRLSRLPVLYPARTFLSLRSCGLGWFWTGLSIA